MNNESTRMTEEGDMEGGRGSSRRGFLLKGGAAGLAGVALAGLAGTEPAGATTADITGPDDPVAVPLRTFDWGTGNLTVADIGTNGVSAARCVRIGPMVWMGYRLLLDAAVTDGPLVLAGSDLPAEYQPRLAGSDVRSLGQAQGIGNGVLIDTSRDADSPPQTSFYPLFFGWDDFTNASYGFAFGLFGLVEQTSASNASMLVNNGGAIPWSDGIRSGTALQVDVWYEATDSPVTRTTAENNPVIGAG